MNDEKMTFSVVGDDGNEINCEVLFTFESEETGKNYIVYTDDSLDEEGNIQIFASIYNPDEEEITLLPIETDKEWEMISKILKELQEDASE